jgi:4-hydroxy-2-oxoheptanedioate aldolase
MTNAMKDKIGRGEAAFGVSLMFPSPQLVEMIAYAGFDWVLIDCGYGSLGLADLEVMAMAADASGITPIARPRSSASADIQAIMDRGVKGVQVPHVNTRADAERIVKAGMPGCVQHSTRRTARADLHPRPAARPGSAT